MGGDDQKIINCPPYPIIRNRENCISKPVIFDICQNYFRCERVLPEEKRNQMAPFMQKRVSQSINQYLLHINPLMYLTMTRVKE